MTDMTEERLAELEAEADVADVTDSLAAVHPRQLRSLVAALRTAWAERDEAKDAGANFVLDALAKALGVEQYVGEDGSETWDGDVSATLYRLLRDSGAIDPETDEPAHKALAKAQARIAALEAQ